jgi:hypothetical protein
MAKKPSAGGVILAAVALGLIAAYMIYRLESNREKQSKEHWIPSRGCPRRHSRAHQDHRATWLC